MTAAEKSGKVQQRGDRAIELRVAAQLENLSQGKRRLSRALRTTSLGTVVCLITFGNDGWAA